MFCTNLHIHEHLNVPTCSIHECYSMYMCRCVCMRTVDGCYLTDVGADASLPEALTAELHCHLTAHSVLLADLLKSFLPNNQPVNYWSAGAQPTGTARILDTPPRPHPFPALPADTLAHAINWNLHGTTSTRYSSGQELQGKWQLCWSWLIEALPWVSMVVGSGGGGGRGCRRAEASVPATQCRGTCLPIKRTTQEPGGCSISSSSRIQNRSTHTASCQPYSK